MLPWELILGEKRTIYSNSCMRKTMSFDNSMTDFSQQSVVFAMERFARAVANMDETVMVPCKLMDVPVGSDPQMDQRVPRRSRALIRRCQAADLHAFYSMLNTLKNELVWGTSREESHPDHPHTSHPQNGSDSSSGSKSKTAESTSVSNNRSSHSSSSNGSSTRSSNSNGSSTRSSNSNGSSTRSSNSSGSGNCSSNSSSKSAESSTGSSNRSSRKSAGRRPSINSMTSTASVSSGIGYSDSDSESGLDQETTEDSGPEAEESIQRVANQFRRHLLGLHQCLEQLSDAANYLTHRYQVEIGNAD